MILSLKDYLFAGAIVILLTTVGISRWELYSARQDLTTLTENLHDQVQMAVNAKNVVIAEQTKKYEMAETGYSGALAILNDRLRKSKVMPRPECLPVAGSGGASSSMPAQTTDTAGTIISLAATAGICDFEFYKKAMTEHVQCQTLIDLLK